MLLSSYEYSHRLGGLGFSVTTLPGTYLDLQFIMCFPFYSVVRDGVLAVRSPTGRRASRGVPPRSPHRAPPGVSRSFLSLKWNEMLVVVVDDGGLVSSGPVIIELEQISRVTVQDTVAS